jgi:GAF domain-containing protein
VSANGDDEPLRRAAESIRRSGNYRWVGIYRVGDEEIRAVAWTGDTPALTEFPRSKGLCGAAVAERRTVVADDVRTDPRYLTTFGDTRSEMVVPIQRDGRVVGLIDVESDQAAAFGTAARQSVERQAFDLSLTWR